MALEKKENAIELQGITKTFGSVVANDHINLEVRRVLFGKLNAAFSVRLKRVFQST